MEQTQDFKSLQSQVTAALVASTRSAGQVASEDLGFHRSFNSEVGAALDEQSQRLLSLASALLKSAASIAELRAPVLDDADDVENNWRGVVDVVDALLEKSDTCLDEYTGVIKRKDPTSSEQSSQAASKSKRQGLGLAYRTQNIVKPQLAFEIKPDNDDNSPWKPILATKPHAKIPLEKSLSTIVDETQEEQYDYSIFMPLLLLPPKPSRPEGLSKPQKRSHKKRVKKLKNMGSIASKSLIDNTDNYFRYRHPYETEILELQYPAAIYQKSEPITYTPVETTSAIFVDTEQGVQDMLKELRSATEIAIDLEHHDARSYVGLVSLMQISTRHKDWIVDTLRPWRQKLQVLNEVFADPKIIKVFHGAYMDIVWLQRDLGLYVVGLFDTHWASRSLGYAGGSLAFLLKKFINFDADKKYQLADWRIRPLPEEMLYYARSDTHFLLYIFDCMRNELVEKSNPEVPDNNLIEIVLQKSKETSLLRYERQVYHAESGRGPGGWYPLLIKTPALLSNEQFAVFKAVHGWRDRIARSDDDSPTFLMSQQVIMNIAKLMPMDAIALASIAHPVAYGVKSRLEELLGVIKSAKAQGTNGPSMMDVLRPDTASVAAKNNVNNAIPKSPSKIMSAVVDQGELRSNDSAFWGGAFGSSIWDGPKLTHNDKLTLSVPLPALSSEVFTAFNEYGVQAASVEKSILEPVPQSQPTEQIDEAFTIKRGANARPDSPSDQEKSDDEFDISLKDVDDEDEEVDAKASKKAKKAAKKLARARAKAAESDEPFDYSKADSVLNAKRKTETQGGNSKKKQKPFDPYSKSADASKGMRRAQTERAGKSQTFKK